MKKFAEYFRNEIFFESKKYEWLYDNKEISNIFSKKILDNSKDSIMHGTQFISMKDIAMTKIKVSLKKTEYITVPLYVKHTNAKYIFGFLYYYAGCEGTDEIKMEYVALGSTFCSADGEYRNFFYHYDDFRRRVKYFRSVIDEIKENLAKDVDLLFEIIMPAYKKDNKRDLKISKEIKKEVSNNISDYYTLCYLFYLYYYKNKIIENHINKKFIDLLYRNKKIYNNVLKKYNIRDIYICLIYKPYTADSGMRCGQKIISMTIDEVKNFNNISESLWREIYIKKKLNTLITSGFTGGLSYFIDWFIINANSELLYDNDISHLKILYSDLIKNEIKKIYNIKNDINKMEQKNILILNKIQKLQKSLDIPINYAEQNIILSKISLCLVDIYKGMPLVDLSVRIKSEDKNISSYSSHIFKDIEHFNFICFKIIYILLLFNKFYNVIHGDLHMNNILLQPISIPILKKYNPNKEIIDLPLYEIYDLNYEDDNDNKNIFILNYGYYIPYIIDFSRAYIYKSDNIDNSVITNSLVETYKKNIISLLKYELRDFYKENKVYILYCINEQFDKFYKIFSAYDIYKFSKGMIILVNNIKTDNKFDEEYINNSHIKLMENINSFSLNFIKKYIYLLYENSEINIPNIGREVIIKFFSQYNILNTKKINEGYIKDVFKISNKIKDETVELNKIYDAVSEKNLKKFDIEEYFITSNKIKNNYEKYLKTCNYNKKIEYIKEHNTY